MKIIVGIFIGIIICLGVMLFIPQKEILQPQQQPKLSTQPNQEKTVFKGSINMLDALDKYIEMNPQDSNAYLQKADYLAKQGKLKEALPFYDRALYYDGRNLQAYMNRGAVNYMMGNYEAAKRDLSVAINLDSSKGENFFNRALANINTGSYAQAKSDFKQAANLFNKSANKKSYEQAKQGYEASSALLAQAKSNNINAPAVAGNTKNQNTQNTFQKSTNEALNQKYTSQLMSALSNPNGMIEKFKEAQKKAGGEPGVMPDFETYAASMREQANQKFKQETAQKSFLDYKDEAYKKQAAGDMEGALKAIDKAIELNPKGADLYNQRAKLNMANKDPKAAIADYTKALGLNPKDGDALYNMALAKEMIGDKKGARQNMQQAEEAYQEQGNKEGLKQAREMQNLWEGKEISSPRQDPDFLKGANAFNNGKYEDALKSWDNLINKYPNEASAYYNRAITKDRLKDSSSEKDYRKAIELNPNMAEAHDGLSNVLISQGKTDEALKHINKSLEINPENPGAYMTLGVVNLEKEDPSNAIANFNKSLSYGGENPALYYYRGAAYGMSGNFNAAQKDMQEVMSKTEPNSPVWNAAKQYLENLKQQQ